MEKKRSELFKKQKILLNLIGRLNNADKPEDILSALAPREVDLLSPEELKGPISLALEHLRLLKSTEQASREWRMTFDAITDPISITDEDHRIIKANKKWAEFAGEYYKKVKGRKCHELLFGKKTICHDCGKNPVNLKIKGKEFLCWTYPIRGIQEKLFVNYYRDVSRERELYKILIERQKLALIGSLSEGIALELNKPLREIHSSTSELLEMLDDSDPRHEFLTDIDEAVTRSLDTIANLHDFGSVERGMSLKDTETTDINRIIRKILPLAEAAMERVKIQEQLSDDIPKTTCNPVRLQQAFFNIIMNAAQAMIPTGGGTLKISSKLVDSSTVRIVFRDSGIGMSKETLQRVFEPFFTTRSGRGGTGLGLYLTREIISSHSGRIEINSSTGKGTKISIYLPVESNARKA